MCSVESAAEAPLRLPNTQWPAARSDASCTTTSKPRSWNVLAAAIPEEPAPMTQIVGGAVMAAQPTEKVTGAANSRRASMPAMEDEPQVRAAGAAVWRRSSAGVEWAVIHRPRYDDWSLAKGK